MQTPKQNHQQPKMYKTLGWVMMVALVGLGVAGWSKLQEVRPALAQEAPLVEATSLDVSRIFVVNVPAIFRELVTMAALEIEGESVFGGETTFEGGVEFQNDTVFDGQITLNGNAFGDGVNIDVGSGEITASNIIYSLEAGSGISISDGQNPTISATDLGSAQSIFKKVKVGSDTAEADANDDTLEFAAGSGISLSIDTGSDKLTITNSSLPGFVKSGTYAVLESGVTRVGIGTSTPGSTVEITSESAGTSGLLFTNLTSASSVGVGGGKVLSVDSGGNVILVTDESGGVQSGDLDSALPGASTGSTIYFDGSSWAHTTNLYHNGGQVGISTVPGTNIRFDVSTNSTTATGMVIRRVSSQTANLLELRNESDSILSYFDADGVFNGSIAGTGSFNPNFTTGSVVFQGPSGLTQDNSEFFWDDTNNRLGIGTSSPSYKLDVTGGINLSSFSTGLRMGGERIAYRDSTALYMGAIDGTSPVRLRSGGLDAVTISTNGNVGIGTTSTGSYSPPGLNTTTPRRMELIVNGSGLDSIFSLGRIDGTSGNRALDIWYDSSTLNAYFDNRFNSNSANINFRTKTDGGTVDALTILGSGNVGVGATNPTAKLQIATGVNNPGIYFGGASTQTVSIGDPGTNFNKIYKSTNAQTINYNAGFNLAAGYGHVFTIDSSQQEVMRIEGNARVGINTAAPLTNLHVTSKTGFANFHSGKALVIFDQLEAQDIFTASASGTTRLVLTNTGDLGIGTTTPGSTLPNLWNNTTGSKLLQISSEDTNTDSGLFLRRSDGATGLDIWSDNGSGKAYIDSRYFNNAGSINFRMKTAGTPVDVMTILATGSVGIGATAPAEKLQVASGNLLLSNEFALRFLNSGATAVDVVRLDSGDDVVIGRTSAGTDNVIFFSGGNRVGQFDTAGNIRLGGTSVSTTPALFIVGSTGNVGIGTTTPGAKLDINGDLFAPTATFSANYAAGVPLTVRGGPSGTGNLSNWQNNAGTVLANVNAGGSFSTTGNIQAGATSAFEARFASYAGASSTLVSLFKGSATQTHNLTEWQNSSGTVLSSINQNGLFNITYNGTSADLISLTQNANSTNTYGGISLANNAGFGLNIRQYSSGFTSSGALQANGSALLSGGAGGMSIAATNAAGALRFYTAGSTDAEERMRITSSGNVGIGTTTPFAASTFWHGLDITGSNVYQAIALKNTGTSGREWRLVTASSGDATLTGKFAIYDQTGSAARLTIDTNGLVGIGTTSPTSAKLGVVYDVGAPAAAYGGHFDVNSTVGYASGTGNIYGVYSDASATGVATGGTQNIYGGYFTATGENTGAGTSNAYGLYVNGATSADNNYSAVFMNGNVGIGTSTPTLAKLEVNGNAYLSAGGNRTSRALYVNGGDGANLLSAGIIGGNDSGGLDSYVKFGTYLNTGFIEQSYIALSRSGNVGIGTTTFGTDAAKVLAIAGSTAPSTAITDGIQLFAVDVAGSHELQVMDEAGNTTTLSPHNFSVIGGRSEDLAWSFYSERNSLAINADMTKALRIVEKLSGEKLIYLKDLSTGNMLEDESDATKITELADNGTIGEIAKWNYTIWTYIGEVIFEKPVQFLAGITVNGKAVFKTETWFGGRVTFADKDMAGFAKIPAGAQEVVITFAKPFAQKPVVTVTPEGESATFTLENVSEQGFTIRLSQPASSEKLFNWIALAVEDAQTTTGQVPSQPETQVNQTINQSSQPSSSPVASPVVSPSPIATPPASPVATPIPTPAASPLPETSPSPDSTQSATLVAQ